jgi:putative hemolysin
MRSSSLFSVLCLLSVACAGETVGSNNQPSVRDAAAPDAVAPDAAPSPSNECGDIGGTCTAVVPGACANGHIVPNLCGGPQSVGSSCCVPDAQPDGGTCKPLKRSNGSENPASLYCIEMGFSLEAVQGPSGASANCVFADSTKCDEWSFFRGQCGQQHSFCASQGGVVHADTTTRPGFTFAVCDLASGIHCDEQQFSQSCVCK